MASRADKSSENTPTPGVTQQQFEEILEGKWECLDILDLDELAEAELAGDLSEAQKGLMHRYELHVEKGCKVCPALYEELTQCIEEKREGKRSNHVSAPAGRSKVK